jgi:hypothetical protein
MCAMKYKRCTGKKVFSEYLNQPVWELTYEDGTTETCMYLDVALMLCDGRLKRA